MTLPFRSGIGLPIHIPNQSKHWIRCIYVACFGQHRNLKDFRNVNFVIVSSSKTRTALNVSVETLIITDHVQSLACCDCIGAVVLNILGF